MIWVWVFLAIAVAGLIVMISYGVWLFHKAADVYSEIRMLGKRGQEIQALLEQLELNPRVTRDQHGELVLLTESSAGSVLAPTE